VHALQKINTPLWLSRAKRCTGNCIHVRMLIQDEPVADEDVHVDVEVMGVCLMARRRSLCTVPAVMRVNPDHTEAHMLV